MILRTTDDERRIAAERAHTYPPGYGRTWGVTDDGEAIDDIDDALVFAEYG